MVEPADLVAAAVAAGLDLIAVCDHDTMASAAGVGFISFLVLYSIHSGIGEGAAGLLLGAMSLTATLSRVGLGIVAGSMNLNTRPHTVE